MPREIEDKHSGAILFQSTPEEKKLALLYKTVESLKKDRNKMHKVIKNLESRVKILEE